MKKPVPKHVVVCDAHHEKLRHIAAERDEKLRKVTHRVVQRGLALEALTEKEES